MALLAGCGGSSSPQPPHGGPVLRLALPLLPRTLDPARVADLPSLNVAHELYAGLTRFSGRGVAPDLADSWEPSEGGLVWTFHLRKGIRWSDGHPITADDFRRAWLRALDPETGSPYARAEMLNIEGARRYHATGSGEVGVQALDDRTLRVTLRHPVPWLDQQVAYPVFFPLRESAWSGPFRLTSRNTHELVLERNPGYWDVASVKPRRITLAISTKGVDAILPRGVAAPGFPWIATSSPPKGRGWRTLPTLSVQLLWLVTKGTPLSDQLARQRLAGLDVFRTAEEQSAAPLAIVVPQAMPGFERLVPGGPVVEGSASGPPRLTLAYTTQDPTASAVAESIRRQLASGGSEVALRPVPTRDQLLRLAGPPAQPGVDMVLLGWSAEYFDAYNILDLFPCASALNVARWCDRSYDRSMRRAVRTLDDDSRYGIEHELVQELQRAVPAIPLYSPYEHVFLKPGVGGFRWSPLGFYELAAMMRS